MKKLFLIFLALSITGVGFAKPNNKKKLNAIEKAFFACVKQCNKAANNDKTACNDKIDALEEALRAIGKIAKTQKLTGSTAEVIKTLDLMKTTCPKAHKSLSKEMK